MKITIALTKEDVVNILGEHLATKGYRINPNSVEFSLKKEYRGYSMDEYEVTVFDGATVDCEV
jgi:hypothetical protein